MRLLEQNKSQQQLLDEAIFILRECASSGVVLGAFSGGKDSIVAKEVCRMAGIAVEWHYHNTTIDPPEVWRFMREHHRDVIWDKPPQGNFFKYARKKNILPSRRMRWCCKVYKERRGPLNCIWITGVRREESAGRRSRPMVDIQPTTRRLHVRPIINWDTETLWEFIRGEGLPYPSLYDEGFHRLGCVACPVSSRKSKERELARWPRVAMKWRRLVEDIYARKTMGFATVDDLWEAYLDNRL